MAWRCSSARWSASPPAIFRGWIGGALMRFTDLMMAFPGAAARHLPGGDLPAQPVDRRHGHRPGELGADRARHLHRDVARSPSATSSTPSAPSARVAPRILFRHILPHLVPTIIVWGTLGISTTVLLEATLSFLGIGVQPPTPSWGNIIFENQTYFQAAPWLVFFPGAAILAAGARLQPGRRRAARRPRSDRSGGAADDRLSRPPAARSRC